MAQDEKEYTGKRYKNPGMRGSTYAVRQAQTSEGETRWFIQRISPDTGAWLSTGPTYWETPEQAQGELDRIAKMCKWPEVK